MHISANCRYARDGRFGFDPRRCLPRNPQIEFKSATATKLGDVFNSIEKDTGYIVCALGEQSSLCPSLGRTARETNPRNATDR